MGYFGLAAVLFLLWTPAAPVRDDGDDQYHFVVGLIEKGHTEMAVQEAQRFLDRFGEHAKANLARYRLASALFDLDRVEDATRHYRELARVRTFEFEDEVRFRLAQCHVAMGRDSDAERLLRQVQEGEKEYLRAPAAYLLADIAFRAEDYERAEALYADVARGSDADAASDALCGLAWCAFRRGQHENATRGIERWLRDRPGDGPRAGEMRFLLAECRFELGRPGEALEVYRSVTKGEFAEAALRGQGFALAALDRHGQAAEAFGALRERFPQGVFAAEAALHRGIELYLADDPRGALEAFEGAQLGDDPESLYWRAEAHRGVGENDVALRLLERAARSGAEGELIERVLAARGDLLADSGRASEALESYTSAGSDYGLYAAAVTSLNAGRGAEAARLARQLLSEHPESSYAAAARLTVAEGAFAAEDYEVAERAFRDVIESGARDEAPRCLSRIAWCRYLRDDRAGAADAFGVVADRFGEAPEAEEARYMRGRAHLEEGARDQAFRAWRDYLSSHRGGEHEPEVRLGLAELEDDPRRAAGHLSAIASNHADHPLAAEALLQLGELFNREGDCERASEAYRAVVEHHAESSAAPHAGYGLAWCAYEGGDFEVARRALRRTLRGLEEGDALRASCLELLVWVARGSGDPGAALAAYGQLAPILDDDARLWSVGKIAVATLSEAGRQREASEMLLKLERALREGPLRIEVRVERAYLALETDDVAAAESIVLGALRDDPGSPVLAEASFFVAEARFEAGERDRAADLYQAAAMNPKNPVADQALYKAGFAFLAQEDTERAAPFFAQLVGDHPRSDLRGETLFLLGECSFREGRYAEAVPAFEQVVAEYPRHEVFPKALFRLGVSLGRLDRHEESLRHLNALAQRHADFDNRLEAELWRGRALARLDERRAARRALARVIEEDRGVLAARARIELGRLHLREDDPGEALSEFLKVTVLYAAGDEVAEALLLAGQTLEAMGDRERAEEQYREVIAKYPNTRFAKDARVRVDTHFEKDARARVRGTDSY